MKIKQFDDYKLTNTKYMVFWNRVSGLSRSFVLLFFSLLRPEIWSRNLRNLFHIWKKVYQYISISSESISDNNSNLFLRNQISFRAKQHTSKSYTQKMKNQITVRHVIIIGLTALFLWSNSRITWQIHSSWLTLSPAPSKYQPTKHNTKPEIMFWEFCKPAQPTNPNIQSSFSQSLFVSGSLLWNLVINKLDINERLLVTLIGCDPLERENSQACVGNKCICDYCKQNACFLAPNRQVFTLMCLEISPECFFNNNVSCITRSSIMQISLPPNS